jgi:hypothetical protein
MPKLSQRTDDTTVNNYVQCARRNGRMHFRICDKCHYTKKCASFKLFKLERVDLYPAASPKKK